MKLSKQIVSAISVLFAGLAIAQEPECLITIPGNTGWGENRSYYCADRVINSVKAVSQVYGLQSTTNDTQTVTEQISLEDALNFHLARVAVLAPALVDEDLSRLGYSEVCYAFDPVVQVNPTYSSSDYMESYRENNGWKELYLRNVWNECAPAGNSSVTGGLYMMTSAFFSYNITYSCPSGYSMKSRYYITDPNVPYCLKIIY